MVTLALLLSVGICRRRTDCRGKRKRCGTERRNQRERDLRRLRDGQRR